MAFNGLIPALLPGALIPPCAGITLGCSDRTAYFRIKPFGTKKDKECKRVELLHHHYKQFKQTFIEALSCSTGILNDQSLTPQKL